MAVDSLAPVRRSAVVRESETGLLIAVFATVAGAASLRALAGVSSRVAAAELTFVSLFVESLPFLLAGALLSHAVQVGPGRRLLTAAARHPRLAGALAPVAGLGLPLCDCGLLPLARTMRARGLERAVNGFLAGAPLTNPIVIITTFLAFPGSPGMVVARVACGFVIAAAVGAVVAGPHTGQALAGHDHGAEHGWFGAVAAELTRSGPALAVGAAMAAALKSALPTSALTSLDHQPLLAAAAMMLLAFVMSICSQADAFVAAALPVGALPRLAFMVLGPVFDLRLAVLYRREFGWRWVLSYGAVVVPVALTAVTVCAVVGLT